MRFTIRPLADPDVDAMLTWRYPAPYDAYDWEASPDDVAALRAGAAGGGDERWFAVDDEGGDLVGFLEFTTRGDQVEFGLGLRPDLTGRGIGAGFVEAAMGFARHRWAPVTFALDVFPWNERAIRAYEVAGFERGDVYVKTFENGAQNTFLRMSRPA